MKRNLSTMILAVAALLAVGLACNTNKKPAPPEYVGVWVAADGAKITISADGGADYISGNGSTKVTGGSFEMAEDGKSFKVGFVGMGPTFKIDKAPANGQMTLDGIVYKNMNGSTTSSSDVKPEIPSKDKLQTLVKTSFMDFGDAVQGEDFTDFHAKVAKVWRDSSTPEKLEEAFKTFTNNKENYNFKRAIATLDAEFSPEPKIDQVQGLDALIVSLSQISNSNIRWTTVHGNSSASTSRSAEIFNI
ncbi:MAG TPA: hypothetical protein PKA82_09490 [Pyrinomonadaceae bacterium]|nr:hypothetical protein [Pyrinomonadaceae bacterium]